MSGWWPWSSTDDASPSLELAPAAEQPPGVVELLQERTDRADAILAAAFREYGRVGLVPMDVIIDARMTLRPALLRPAVPVVPGPDR